MKLKSAQPGGESAADSRCLDKQVANGSFHETVSGRQSFQNCDPDVQCCGNRVTENFGSIAFTVPFENRRVPVPEGYGPFKGPHSPTARAPPDKQP